jgi:hypothetical protein
MRPNQPVSRPWRALIVVTFYISSAVAMSRARGVNRQGP